MIATHRTFKIDFDFQEFKPIDESLFLTSFVYPCIAIISTLRIDICPYLIPFSVTSAVMVL